MSFEKLTEEQLDLLQEIGSIGMGHAATALSQMLNKSIHLYVPRATVTGFGEVPGLLGGAERVVAGVALQVQGAVRGEILMIFPLADAERLLGELVGGDLPIDTEMGTSALLEVGNILASAYLNALGQLLGQTLTPSVPRWAVDMAGAVVDGVLIELGRSGDLALMLETEFYGEPGGDAPIRGHFVLLPSPESLEVFLQLAGDGG